MTAVKANRSHKRRKLSPPEDRSNQSAQKRQLRPGLEGNTAKSQDGPTDFKAPENLDAEVLSVKGLDSSEPAVRRSTLKSILGALRSRPTSAPLTPTQCLQLWRGFFVMVYMHDSRNLLSVQNLLREIAGTFALVSAKDTSAGEAVPELDQPSCTFGLWLNPYHAAFWEIVQREWTQIDSHRMNKYLLLVRFVLRELFTSCVTLAFEADEIVAKPTSKATQKTNLGEDSQATTNTTPSSRSVRRTKDCVEVLETAGPLNPSNRKVSDGLRLHVLDVWNDELTGALSDLEASHEPGEDSDFEVSPQAKKLTELLQMFRVPISNISKSDSGAQKHVRMRAKETDKEMDEYLKKRSENLA